MGPHVQETKVAFLTAITDPAVYAQVIHATYMEWEGCPHTLVCQSSPRH